MVKKKEIVIVGANKLGASLAKILFSNEKINVKAVVKTGYEEEKREYLKDLGIKVVDSWDEIINKDSVDLIIELTGNDEIYRTLYRDVSGKVAITGKVTGQIMETVFKHIWETEKISKGTGNEIEAQPREHTKTDQAIKLFYDELEKKNKELKERDKLKSEFISTVSHELRTPLTIIREGVSLINDKIFGDINRQQSDILVDVLESVDRLTKIINDLLSISRIESGKLKLQREEVDTADLINNIVRAFGIKAQSKKITFESKLRDSLPNIFGDKDRLMQVLTNLIGNAIKFTPEKGRITIEAKTVGDAVEISVSDTGIGITRDDIPKVFDRFQQFGRTPGPGERGTGLGLAISKDIVELHGGRIWITSEVNKGSVFSFIIPRFEASKSMCSKIMKDLFDKMKKEGKKEDFSLIGVNIGNMDKIKSSQEEKETGRVMSTVADAIRGYVSRQEDIVMPYRSGTILIVLPQTDLSGGKAVCKRIEDNLSPSITIMEKNLDLNINLDINYVVLNIPEDAKNIEGLMQKLEKVLKIK
ncbi:MAG: diguanylate cyclase [Candidatus Aminicenantes bacterium]|nr:diguanylate cyclase [Candidatus Aminicenantes bacterium]